MIIRNNEEYKHYIQKLHDNDISLNDELELRQYQCKHIINKNTERGKAWYDKTIWRIRLLKKTIAEEDILIQKYAIDGIRNIQISIIKNGFKVCDKCVGIGKILNYLHIDNGNCFKCKGTGRI